jgi:hypothetical protein
MLGMAGMELHHNSLVLDSVAVPSGMSGLHCVVTPLDAWQCGCAVKQCYSFLMSSLICIPF